MQRLPQIHYELELSEEIGAPWTVTKIQVDEALDQPYLALVDAKADISVDVDTDFDKLLGCDAVLTLLRRQDGEDRSNRRVCGVVTRLDFLGHEAGYPIVRFHIAPAFALLRQRVDSRIWQGTSVQDIVGEVLDVPLSELDRAFDFDKTKRGSKPRDYCTQYRESDFDFVSRLLEEEGIAYEFRHEDSGKESLVFRDDNSAYATLKNLDGAAEIPCIDVNPENADVESIQSFEWTRRMTTTAVLRRDFEWKTPRDLLTEPAEGKDERGRVRRVYVHGGRRYVTDDLVERAKDVQEASLSLGKRARGRSNVTAMRPGLKFTLTGHGRSDLLREYLIVGVEHFGSDTHTSKPGAEIEDGYYNEFECIPIDVVARPELKTSKPCVRGPQTAIVTGAEGDEICTDEHGRIHVQFHWQERPEYSDTSSCWIRCAQSWAGLGWGAQFIPRVGMEVVVEFLEGNPDRPLVTGCVYNGDNPAPFALPDNKTQSGWRTSSSPGGNGFNELRFEDAAGSEEIYIHGQKNWTIAIENDKAESIGNDEINTIGHDHTETIGNDAKLDVGHDETITIGNNQTITIGVDQTLSVGSNQQASIGADRSETIASNATETVGIAKTTIVGGLFAQTVGGAMATLVGGEITIGVGGSHSLTVGGDASEAIVGDKDVSSQSLSITTRAETTASSGKDMTLTSGKKLSVAAKDDVSVKGEKAAMLEFADKFVLKCGQASMTFKKDGTIEIRGKNLTLKASGNLVAKGGKIGQN